MQHSKVQLLTNEGDVVDTDVQGPLMVARGQRVRFLMRPKCVAYRPEHITIDDEPQDWKVYDVNIHGRSQFHRTGDDERDAIPGDAFNAMSNPISGRLHLETVQTAMNFWIDVAYMGSRPDAPFICTIRGTAAL